MLRRNEEIGAGGSGEWGLRRLPVETRQAGDKIEMLVAGDERGVMSTTGGLVFSGTMEGDFFAVDAATRKLLWRFQTGGPVWSSPVSEGSNTLRSPPVAPSLG